MDTPKTIFIDTCIFDGNHYNFHSNDFESIKKTFKKGELTLLMPATTLAEINKHISAMSEEIVKALTKAQQQSPFLTKLDFWPNKKAREGLSQQARIATFKDLNEFLEYCNLKHLMYEGASITQVMYWHNNSLPPFSDKKPNEFRDAITISTLMAFQTKENKGPIVIISSDGDFREACLNDPNLIYFSSVDKYVESSIKGDSRVEIIRQGIKEHGLPLEAVVTEEFPNLGFTHEDDWDADIDGVTVEDITIVDYSVVHVGDEECVVSVDLIVKYEANVTMDDPDSDGYFGRKLSGDVSDDCRIKCLVKCKMNTDFTVVRSVGGIYFPDDDTITIAEVPEKRADYSDDDM